MQTTIGITAAVISTASWATCTLILKKLGEKLDPIGMTAVKSVLSVIFLTVFMLVFGYQFLIPQEFLVPIAISGIIGITLGDSLFFASLSKLSPFLIAIILFAGPDIFSGLFGFFMLKEMPTISEWIAIFLILIGLACFIFPIEKNNEDKTKTTISGIILALLSLICTAYSMAIIKPVLVNISAVTATMYRMLFSGLSLIVLGFISRKIFVWQDAMKDKNYNLKFSATIFLATFGGFFLSLLAVKHCELIIASSIMSLEPLFILIFMIVFCKYKPKVKELGGIIASLSGLLILFKG